MVPLALDHLPNPSYSSVFFKILYTRVIHNKQEGEKKKHYMFFINIYC